MNLIGESILEDYKYNLILAHISMNLIGESILEDYKYNLILAHISMNLIGESILEDYKYNQFYKCKKYRSQQILKKKQKQHSTKKNKLLKRENKMPVKVA